MADTSSTTKFKADISQLKAAMQQASRQVKLANSEFKAATAGLDDWSKSADGLQAKIKQLNSTLDAQRKKVDLANEEYEKTVKLYGEGSAEADRAKIALNNYEAAVAKTEKELSQYEKELDDCENETGDFADETEDLDSAVRDVSDGFTVMKGALASLVADGLRLAIDAIKDFTRETINAGMNFEQGMAQVAAVSGASAEEIDQLTAKAKEMGASTKFSATESAEAFNYMAMAGWKTEDMLNGIEGIMNLAAASGADLATTSDIVTDALTAMGYEAGDAGHLADVMAAAASNANTNVEMMGATFQYAAPLVGAMGYNMEDTAVAIGLMANAGIKADKAGTALRSILSRLSAPPKECADAMDTLGISLTDSEGNMKSLDRVMQDLRDAFSDLSETQQTEMAKSLAGQEAMSGLLAIVNAAPADYAKLTKAVQESEGAAQSMADTMNDTVAGQMTLLKSQIEGVQIEIFEKLAPALREGIDKISEYIASVNWDKVGEKLGDFALNAVEFFIKIVEHGEDIIEILKSIGKVLVVTFVASKLLSFISTVANLVTTFKTLKTATEAATTAQKLLNLAEASTPIGMVVAAVAGLTTGLIYLATRTKEAEQVTANLTDSEREQIEAVNEMSKAYADMKSARDESVSAITAEYGKYEELAAELDTLVDANGQVKKGYEDRAGFIVTTLNEALGLEMELTDGVIQNYKEQKQAIEDLIETKKAQAILEANESGYTEAIQNEKEALNNLTETSKIYNEHLKRQQSLQSEYNRLLGMSVEEYAALNGYGHDYEDAAYAMEQAQDRLNKAMQEADLGVYEAGQAYREAEATYVGYQATIKNYEGLSAAIISGDQKKISESLQNMVNDFITAETGTKDSLERQKKVMEENYEALQQAVDDGSTVVTKEMVDDAKKMVDKANAELKKFEKESSKTAKKTGENYADGLKSTQKNTQAEGKNLSSSAEKGAKEGASGMNSAGKTAGTQYSNGVSSQKSSANAAGKSLGTSAKSGAESVDTTQSGKYFGEGFVNGIKSLFSSAFNKAKELAQEAHKGLKKGQQEGSPSKLTYQSGIFFVQGYINGIASRQKQLQQTIKNMVSNVFTELKKMTNYNFDEVADKASEGFSNSFSSKMDYMVNRMSYENEKKIEDFDKTMEELEAKKEAAAAQIQKDTDWMVNIYSNIASAGIEGEEEYYKTVIENEKEKGKKLIEASNANYDNLINNQKKYKEAYQSASSEMISGFSSAMASYQNKAQALIDDTINGITDTYNKRYDALLNKQETLITKMKSASDLFSISGAGVMTVNDIQEQTRQIKEYADKLSKIKEKVSSDLFDQISSYDMKEGSAFIERLLELSASDLRAYDQAYTEKMEAASKTAENIYKSDFSQVAKDYQTELTGAFAGLDSTLEELGKQCMKGFVDGLVSSTDYMDDEVRLFIQSMVDTFKKELQIHSPSKVMMKIGDYTGQGFVDGLMDTIGEVKKTAQSIAQSAAMPLDSMTSNIIPFKSAVAGNTVGSTNVINNYNLVQNNTSPKSLSALETYRARQQQIAMVKALA